MSLTDFRIFSGRCPDPPPKPNPTSDSVANSALNTRNYLSPQQVKGRVVEDDQFSYETQPHHQLGGGFGLCTEEAHSEADRQVGGGSCSEAQGPIHQENNQGDGHPQEHRTEVP